jgi:hypothetical protein
MFLRLAPVDQFRQGSQRFLGRDFEQGSESRLTVESYDFAWRLR